MNRWTAVSILFVASFLEAGGDALMRTAMHSSQTLRKIILFGGGAVVLFTYGYVVNAPPWDFGRLLGLYVVFFFLSAQLVSWLFFNQPPGRAVLVGGALIIGGGLVIALSQQ
jgi:multidrug transporter EmrE-like cation transporter